MPSMRRGWQLAGQRQDDGMQARFVRLDASSVTLSHLLSFRVVSSPFLLDPFVSTPPSGRAQPIIPSPYAAAAIAKSA